MKIRKILVGIVFAAMLAFTACASGDTQMSEEELCERAAEQGIHLMGISEHYIHKPPVSKPVILLGYGKPDEKRILEGLDRLEHMILK